MDDPLLHYHLETQFLDDDEVTCPQQVLNSTAQTISKLILLVAVFKALKQLGISVKVRAFINVAATSFVVAYFSSDKLLSVAIFHTFTIFSLFLAQRRRSGYVVLVGNIAALIFLQIYCKWQGNDEYFLSIRGILMMHIMRLVTVAFKTNEVPPTPLKCTQLAHYLEYIYYTPLIIFGPYLTFEQFGKMRTKKWDNFQDELAVALRASVFMFLAISCATFSSCAFEIFSPSNQFEEDALTALSFRQSHYFICWCTQAFIMILGSDVAVTYPPDIEISRSTLQTVSEWNKPFHTFLHEYVFQRRFFATTAANVFLTFIISALLHGLDFQMTITLVALGFIAYSETVFRKRLARRLSMCINAKPCLIRANRLVCNHRYSEHTYPAKVINGLFVILSMYHLIFTGMTFTDDYSAIGYPRNHAFTIWATHYYASFVISIVFLVLSKII